MRCFDEEVAARYGLPEAIFLGRLAEILASDRAIFDGGHLWAALSIQDWRAEFPFWSERAIKYTLKRLRQKGLIAVRRGKPSRVRLAERENDCYTQHKCKSCTYEIAISEQGFVEIGD